MSWKTLTLLGLLSMMIENTEAVGIRVASFNIGAHFTFNSSGIYYPDYSLGHAGTADHDRVREILGRLNADVVALEEIHSADIAANDVAILASSLGYPFVYIAPSTNAFDATLHVIFLSKYPFLSQTSINSPPGARELTRLFPTVKVDVPGTNRDPVIVAAHLKSGSDPTDRFRRAVELRRLSGYLTTQGLTAADNFVVMGDFNLSSINSTYTALPAGLPSSYSLGTDVLLPISYSVNPLSYFSNPVVSRLDPRQLDNSMVTFPASLSTIDLFLVSPVIAGRPLATEIYNSTLDIANGVGLVKAGSPLAVGTSAAASDHFAIAADLELDAAIPYAFTTAGQTVVENFANFPGTYDPNPWLTTGGTWQGADAGTSAVTGFRAYGAPLDPALGFLAGQGDGTASATFVNQASTTLGALKISYHAEQWRSASGGSLDAVTVDLFVNGIANPIPSLTFTAVNNLPSGLIVGGVSTLKSATLTGLNIPPGAEFQLRFTFSQGVGGGMAPTDVFLNEFHYDNAGADQGEFVEVVVGPGYAGSLGDIDLLFYNGGNGTVYKTLNLAAPTVSLESTVDGYRVYSADVAGIQNDVDGIAVVNHTTQQVYHFLSYEGSFVATNGLAAGMTSTNIGVFQTGNEPVGTLPLGLTGSGGMSQDFTWAKIAGSSSKGAINPLQMLVNPVLPPQGIAIDDLAVTYLADGDDDGFTDADEAVFGTDPADAASHFTMSFTYLSAGAVELNFATVLGRNYTIESSANLVDWATVSSLPGSGNQELVSLPTGLGEVTHFYRVKVTLGN